MESASKNTHTDCSLIEMPLMVWKQKFRPVSDKADSVTLLQSVIFYKDFYCGLFQHLTAVLKLNYKCVSSLSFPTTNLPLIPDNTTLCHQTY